jgi:hypothetical protein
MEIDALEQLISEDVKVQGQIMCDGFRTCLMVFRIVAKLLPEPSPELLPESSP